MDFHYTFYVYFMYSSADYYLSHVECKLKIKEIRIKNRTTNKILKQGTEENTAHWILIGEIKGTKKWKKMDPGTTIFFCNQ